MFIPQLTNHLTKYEMWIRVYEKGDSYTINELHRKMKDEKRNVNAYKKDYTLFGYK